jgi:hypothetical protein
MRLFGVDVALLDGIDGQMMAMICPSCAPGASGGLQAEEESPRKTIARHARSRRRARVLALSRPS